MPNRMKFIPALREHIKRGLLKQGLHAPAADEALDRWNDGKEPITPVQCGCFAVFEKVQKDVEAHS